MAESKDGSYNKYDIEMAKVARDVEHSANVRANLKTVFKYGSQMLLYVCVAICVWKVFEELPEVLKRTEVVIREFRLATITHGVVTAFLAFIVFVQRKRLKRLTVKSGNQRHMIEKDDCGAPSKARQS